MTTYLDEDPELDRLLLAAAPLTADALHTVSTSTAATDLRGAIAAHGHHSPATRLRRSLLVAAVLAAAAVTALGLGSVPGSHPESAYGAALVRFAQNSPRLLVGAPDWRVTRADEDDARTGEMTFTHGQQALDVHWVPGAHGKDSDRNDMTPAGTTHVDGRTAWVGNFGSAAAPEFEAIWSVGDQAYDARGVFADKAAFDAVVTTLHRVGVNAWLGALPASVVKPGSRLAVVETMLRDVPLPPHFDVHALTGSSTVNDRYQLGARVTGAVTCAWVHRWSHGDPATRRAAAAAMRTSRQWKVLREMAVQGEFSQVVWQVADAMNGTPFPMPPHTTLEQWAKPALGC